MNWLLIAIILILIVALIIGYKRGFAKMVLSAVSTILAIILVIFLAPKAHELVLNNTNWEASLTTTIQEKIFDATLEDEDIQAQISKIKASESTPELIQQKIDELEKTIRESAITLSEKAASAVISMIIYVLLFILISILLNVITHLIGLATKIPGIHQVDGLLGLLLGGVEAFIGIWFALMIIETFSYTTWGTVLNNYISDSKILQFLSDKNLLLSIWSGIKKY